MPPVINTSIQKLINDLKTNGLWAAIAQGFYVPATAWTPTYYGATAAGVTTYTAQVGYYTRVGDTVNVWGVVGWSAATGTGNGRFGLPFTVIDVAGFGVPVTLRFNSVTYAGDSFQGLAVANTDYFEIAGITSNAAPTISAVENNSTAVIFSLSYPIE